MNNGRINDLVVFGVLTTEPVNCGRSSFSSRLFTMDRFNKQLKKENEEN